MVTDTDEEVEGEEQGLVRRFTQRIWSSLMAGTLVVVPFAVTFWVLGVLVQVLDEFVPVAWRAEAIVGYDVPGVGAVLTMVLLVVVGFLTQFYFGRRIVDAYELVVLRVPVLSSIYQGVKQVLESLAQRDRTAFQTVVLVQWPRPGVYSLAFHTGTAWAQRDGQDTKMLNVFLPSTPNPTTGFYFLVPEDEVIVTDLSVEQAAKVLMSAGIVAPEATLDLTTQEVPRTTGGDE